MKYKYSQKQSAVRKRIKNLPQIFERSMRSVYKKEAVELAKTFEVAIKNDQLGLERLSPNTIKEKKRKGYAKPSTPLFARGKFAEMMKIVEGEKKWIVKPANRQFTSKLKLIDILEIHAAGYTIKRGDKLIRVPARPARSRAFSLYLKRRKKIDANRQIWDAINQLIKTNKNKYESVNQ
jgi:hypothetical protein